MRPPEISSIAAFAPILTLWNLPSQSRADVAPFSDMPSFEKAVDESGGFPSQTYRSSDIRGPVFQVNSQDLTCADDSRHIFIGSVYGEGKAGPMILDSRDLSLVYADQQFANTYHSDVQVINGKPYYLFWEGQRSRGHAKGYCLFFDEKYNLTYDVTAKDRPGVMADMHDLRVTHDGHVIFTTYFNIPFDTSTVGGEADSMIMDCGFQEVDIVTNEVLFDWAASDHFNIASSKAPYSAGYGVGPDSGYDFAHINSVEKTPEGDYLISMRHLSVIALLSGKDGHPVWILGGSLNQFDDLSAGRATDFSWQHDARFHLGNTSQITMFDNHGEQTQPCSPSQCKTRGLHIEIDSTAMTARLLKEYYHPEGINSGAMGGMTTLENGNVMIAWGYNPSYTEFAPDGSAVLSFDRGRRRHLPDMFAYRVTKGNWVGRPTWPPSVAVDRPSESSENATLYLSWNGATEVATWEVRVSDSSNDRFADCKDVVRSDRGGFETVVSLGTSTHVPRRFIAAVALDARNQALGATAVIDMSDGSVARHGQVFPVASSLKQKKHAWPGRAPILVLAVMTLCFASLKWKRRAVLSDVEKGWYKPLYRTE